MLYPKPPENLVQLSTLPPEEWVGKRVWLPCCQVGTTPFWREGDIPEGPLRDPDLSEAELLEYNYDVGVVLRVHRPAWGAQCDRWEARFACEFPLGTPRGLLQYPGETLWIEVTDGSR